MPSRTRTISLSIFLTSLMVAWTGDSSAEESLHGDPISIRRATGNIVVDGDLSDPAWKEASRVDTWYETNPGDNVPPVVKSIAWLAYDDKFLYVAFQFSDPEPSKIRAPYGDRDNIGGYLDYGGVILDTRNDGKTGLLLLANPRGIQYDAVTDDVTGNEDSSPDFYWDSAARITAEGWVLEIRVPFSSLRYSDADPQTWGILLYRNYPRDFRRQIFSAKLPRGGNCFVCRSNVLTGLSGLPHGGHVVAAPYATGTRTAFRETAQRPSGREASFEHDDGEADGGLDAKWTPGANTSVDATINPDFSQIESDVAQISANERFALFFPEKRPFFLEGVELLSTPVQAVYTRTITSPRWGARATGKFEHFAYTALIAEDRGGGSVIVPGPNSSSFVDQDFGSYVFIGRARHDIGRSFVSFLATDREIKSDRGYNRVLGPDFQWRTGRDTVTGQLLISRTVVPDRPDLFGDSSGSSSTSHAGELWWSHSTSTLDWFGQYKDYGNDFRADDGFVPQVGFRAAYGEGGYTFHPTGFLSRLRTFLIADRSEDRSGNLISREFSAGTGMDGRWNSFMRFRLAWDRVHAGDREIPRRRLLYVFQVSPSLAISQISLDGSIGEEIDFFNSRRGEGGTINLSTTLRPTDHLELRAIADRAWLDVEPPNEAPSSRLFTADVQRLRATYTFNARSFLRLIGQRVVTRFDPSLFAFEVPSKSTSFTGSALFAYKLNWQSVLFLGYGDDRARTRLEELIDERRRHQLFLKVSYAFQR